MLVVGPGQGSLVATVLAVGLAAASPVAKGAAPAAAADAPGAAEPAVDETTLAQAEQLYDRGKAEFETADYAAAVDLWTEAYRLVPDLPESSRIKALLIYNIATARERAFEVDEDPQQLRQAKILLESYEESIPDLYGEGEAAEAERAKVRERMASIDAALHAATGDDEPTPPPVVEPPPTTADAGPAHPGRPLVIAGAVLVGVGVAGLAVMGAGLGIGAGANDISGLDDDDITGRRDQFARGRTGNGMALGGGIAGGVLAVTGAVLLGIGVAKNKKAAPTAWLGPGSAGVGVRGRF